MIVKTDKCSHKSEDTSKFERTLVSVSLDKFWGYVDHYKNNINDFINHIIFRLQNLGNTPIIL